METKNEDRGRRTMTERYLNEKILFGGPEPITRGEAIRHMVAEGIPQPRIDAYMMGAQTLSENSAEDDDHEDPEEC